MGDHIKDDDVWPVINSFFKSYGVDYNQISQYNNFIQNSGKVLSRYGNFKIEYKKKDGSTGCIKVALKNLQYDSPKNETSKNSKDIYPYECLVQKVSYESEIFVDLEVTTEKGITEVKKHLSIGKMPVMTGSCLCNLRKIKHDPKELAKRGEEFGISGIGGQILIKSKTGESIQPRITVGIERNWINQVFVLSGKKEKKPPKFTRYVQIQSQPEGGSSCSFSIGELSVAKNKKNETVPELVCLLPKISTLVPVFVLLRALGTDIEEVPELIFGDYDPGDDVILSLQKSAEQSFPFIQTPESASERIAFLASVKPPAPTVVEEEKEPEVEEVEDVEWIGDEEEEEEVVFDVKRLLTVDLLPHLGQDYRKKALFICNMICSYYLEPLTNRDSYEFKTVALGHLFYQQFSAAIRALISQTILKAVPIYEKGQSSAIDQLIPNDVVTEMMKRAFIKNHWTGVKHASSASQAHSTYNTQDRMANLRKSEIPQTSGSVSERRQLHGTVYGFICSETPEGKDVGKKKNLAMSSIMSLGLDPGPLKLIIEKVGNMTPVLESRKNQSRVLVNGDWIGSVDDPHLFARTLRALRRDKVLHSEISISVKETQGRYCADVRVSTEAGRYIRPLFVVLEGELMLKSHHIHEVEAHRKNWKDLENEGIIEFLDAREAANANIIFYPSDLQAMPEETRKMVTHCEMHASLMFGLGISMVPFVQHDPAARGSYTANMSKQAPGWPFYNPRAISSKIVYSCYPQKALASTCISDAIEIEEQPAGTNAITYIALDPSNPEDAIVFNQAFLDRGGLRAFEKKTFIAEEEERVRFMKPHPLRCGTFTGNTRLLDHLEDDEIAVADIGSRVEDGDILVGRLYEKTTRQPDEVPFVNKSLVYSGNPGIITDVTIAQGGTGYTRITIHISYTRQVRRGDKFAARHGQKGTCGAIRQPEDMPFSANDGIIPDVVWSCLAFNSRMTIGMLIEMITSKAATVSYPEEAKEMDAKDFFDYIIKKGGLVNATPFRKYGDTPSEPGVNPIFGIVERALKSAGFTFHDDFICGMTGDSLGPGLIGPLYIQRLKHMAEDKAHARARGGVSLTTRQPLEGRAKKGGHRIGIQEVANFEGNGASFVLNERTYKSSDYYVEWRCCVCGMPVVHHAGSKESDVCRSCHSSDVTPIAIPYGTKLVFTEQAAMNIFTRLIPE